jgi:hypothetical protein
VGTGGGKNREREREFIWKQEGKNEENKESKLMGTTVLGI